jgi:hypothetical protein
LNLPKNHLFYINRITLLFVFTLVGPWSFAWQTNQPLANVGSNHSDPSASVFIRLGSDLSMNFRSGQNLSESRALLGPGSVIQIPTHVARFDQNGQIDLGLTLEYWQQLARYQRQNQGLSHLQEIAWDCQRLGLDESGGQCGNIRNGELFFPVRVVRDSSGRVNTDSSERYGYLALDFLNTEIDPSRYQTMYTNLESALEVSPPPPITAAPPTPPSGGGETTTNEPPPAPAAPPAAADNVNNCNNTQYLTSRQNFARHSCLANRSVQQRAELVMRDVNRINQLRTSFNLDPRFSACIAYRESHMHPNAKGGTPDWGMYQVIDSTGRSVLRRNRPVTPGFAQYQNNWVQYRDNMIRSTLAQADLHHSVLKEKATQHNLIGRINAGSTDVSLYQTLATRYNGSGSRARHYGQRIANCYRAMQQVATRDGRITNPARLQAALNQALN